MRRLPLLLACVFLGTVAAVAPSAGGGGGRVRQPFGGSLTIRLPAGWYERRAWLSDVRDPIPRLAVASFPVRLSRHTCECGFPNVIAFPRDGAFVFVWEYPDLSRRALERVPHRPRHVRLASWRAARATCLGASASVDFQAHRDAFDVGIYLGPAVSWRTRSQVVALLDSLRVSES